MILLGMDYELCFVAKITGSIKKHLKLMMELGENGEMYRCVIKVSIFIQLESNMKILEVILI